MDRWESERDRYGSDRRERGGEPREDGRSAGAERARPREKCDAPLSRLLFGDDAFDGPKGEPFGG